MAETRLVTPLGRARWRIKQEWRKLLISAADNDDDVSRHYRAIASGLGDALRILDEECRRDPGPERSRDG